MYLEYFDEVELVKECDGYYYNVHDCLLKTINIDSLNKCFMNLVTVLIEQARTNTADKANEIPIVQELITELDIKGKTVVADATSFCAR